MPWTKVIAAVNGLDRDFNWVKIKPCLLPGEPFSLRGYPCELEERQDLCFGPCTDEDSRLLSRRILKSRWKQGLRGKLRFFLIQASSCRPQMAWLTPSTAFGAAVLCGKVSMPSSPAGRMAEVHFSAHSLLSEMPLPLWGPLWGNSCPDCRLGVPAGFAGPVPTCCGDQAGRCTWALGGSCLLGKAYGKWKAIFSVHLVCPFFAGC